MPSFISFSWLRDTGMFCSFLILIEKKYFTIVGRCQIKTVNTKNGYVLKMKTGKNLAFTHKRKKQEHEKIVVRRKAQVNRVQSGQKRQKPLFDKHPVMKVLGTPQKN